MVGQVTCGWYNALNPASCVRTTSKSYGEILNIEQLICENDVNFGLNNCVNWN